MFKKALSHPGDQNVLPLFRPSCKWARKK